METSEPGSWLDRVRGASPNPLAQHYREFRVDERLLLTGHSHQAWPDRARDGQLRAFEDAATHVDDKWGRAFATADRVRRGWTRWLADPSGTIALGPSTHDLLVRWMSTLDLRSRPRFVTTRGEFHAMRRQFDRLEEEGVEVVRVPVDDLDAIPERLVAETDDRTAAVFVSAVLFRDARIVPGLGHVARAAATRGADIVVDAYHAINVVPFSIPDLGLDDAWVTGGGYKYAQLGEGNAFLRVPPGRRPRPVVTGWFAEFDDLARSTPGRVGYGPGAAAFGSATYDPTSHYRAASVLDFFEEEDLHPDALRAINLHQTAILRRGIDDLGLDPALLCLATEEPPARLGGFVALRSPRAERLAAEMARRGLDVDRRADVVRLGPAPYLADEQLLEAVEIVGEAAASLSV